MLSARVIAIAPLIGTTVLSAEFAHAQEFPSRPIRIVTSGAGSGNDFISRLIAQGITGALGQPIIVDNRPSGVIPGDAVAKAAPDGYTILFAGSGLWIGSLLEKTPYDPIADFAPISWIDKSPNILVVHPSLRIKSVKELVALAKARPGELNYASSGTGSSTHLAAELFKSLAKVNIVRINYKNAGAAMSDLIGGQVQLYFSTATLAAPYLRSGKLNGLAVTTAEPSALRPELPTIAASGLPGYESASTSNMFAPARTPAVVINRLNQEIVRYLKLPETRERFFNAGSEVVGSSPEAHAAYIKADLARMSKLIKESDIRVD